MSAIAVFQEGAGVRGKMSGGGVKCPMTSQLEDILDECRRRGEGK